MHRQYEPPSAQRLFSLLLLMTFPRAAPALRSPFCLRLSNRLPSYKVGDDRGS